MWHDDAPVVHGLTGNLIKESAFTGNVKYSVLQGTFGTGKRQGRGSDHIQDLVQRCGVTSSSKMIHSNLIAD